MSTLLSRPIRPLAALSLALPMAGVPGTAGTIRPALVAGATDHVRVRFGRGEASRLHVLLQQPD